MKKPPLIVLYESMDRFLQLISSLNFEVFHCISIQGFDVYYFSLPYFSYFGPF